MLKWGHSLKLRGKKAEKFPYRPGDIVLVHDKSRDWFAEVVVPFDDVLVVVSNQPAPIRKKENPTNAYRMVEKYKLSRVWPS